MHCTTFLAPTLPVTLRRPRSATRTPGACLIENQPRAKSVAAPAPVTGKPPVPVYANDAPANNTYQSNGVAHAAVSAPAPAPQLTPSRRRISWSSPPRRILLAVAPHSQRALEALPKLARHLHDTYASTLYVEGAACEDAAPVDKLPNGSVKDHIDLVICLGGDGLILHVVSTLFPDQCPPLMPFNMGSLGFLATFDFAQHQQHLAINLRAEHVDVVSRMRLRCRVVRAEERSCVLNYREEKMVQECGLQPDADYHVLNELVIDRGPAPYLSNLEVLCDDCPVTRVQADGLILATPTGSTAYNVSAGGSMVHPDVPAILFTPICPHSLSFRPVLFPVTSTITIKVPDDARAGAWVCFDGRSRMELMRGDKVVVERSQWEVPTICKNDVTHDWFRSISKCLRWNERLMQGANDVVIDEESNGPM